MAEYPGYALFKNANEDKFEKICNLFGFGSFELWYSRAQVTFEY